MPIYEKLRRGRKVWQVVVHVRGARRDLIVRGSEQDARAAERGLFAQMQVTIPRSTPAWRRVARQRRQGSISTFIYFIQAGEDGPIKIGRADNVARRLESLQTANHEQLRLLAAIRTTGIGEGWFHDRYRDAHIHGEWFRPVPKLLRMVRVLARRTEDRK